MLLSALTTFTCGKVRWICSPSRTSALVAAPNVEPVGVMTHFATADAQDEGFFREQLEDGRRLAEIGIPRAGVRTLQDRFEKTGRRDYCDRLWSLVVLDRSIQRLFGAST